jgi:hypothetical protein
MYVNKNQKQRAYFIEKFECLFNIETETGKGFAETKQTKDKNRKKLSATTISIIEFHKELCIYRE